MPFQSLTIDPAFPADWRARIDAAMPTLEYVLRRAADRLAVEWHHEPGGTATLAITDHEICRVEQYTAQELAVPRTYRWRFSRQWGEILATRSDRLMKVIRDGLEEPVGV